MDRCYGRYAGVVEDADDPDGRGRIRVTVPEVAGAAGLWAEVAPLAGLGLPKPAVGARVLIEFLGGDPARPLWSGHALADGAAAAEWIAPGGATLRFGAGGVEIAFGACRITLDAAGIRLEAPQVGLGEGAATPLVNGPALLELLNGHVHVGGPVTGPALPPFPNGLLLKRVTGA